MSDDRIEIEKADNGWTVNVWSSKKSDESSEEMMYHGPERLVATSEEEVMKIVKENL